MLFKRFFFVIILLITHTASADETLTPFHQQGDIDHPQPNNKESYFATKAPIESQFRGYIGLDFGSAYTFLHLKITKSSVEKKPNENVLGYTGGAYGGLGANFDHFYIGAELNGAYNSLKKDINVTLFGSNKISITQPLIIGLDFIPGYLSDQKKFLLYGRLGISTSWFTFKINEISDSNANKIALGLRAGLGVEYFLSEIFSTRIEYLCNIYKKINGSYTSGTTIYNYELASSNTHQVKLSLLVNF